MEHTSPQHIPDDLSPPLDSAAEQELPALPSEPMAPLFDAELPTGSEWGFQLKWDGIRILARLNGCGQVELFSRKLYLKNAIYPEMTAVLESKRAWGPCLLDGEFVWWDGIRPNFQQVLKRERSRGLARQPLPPAAAGAQAALPAIPAEQRPGSDLSGTGSGVPASASVHQSFGALVYVLFDLLSDESGDLRHLPYEERHRRLTALVGTDDPRVFVTDLFRDGEALWTWVETNRWEGVVSKRLSSPYREGKKHRDWLKKKIALVLDVDIVGLKWRNGLIASLVMELEGEYLGSVSLGLNDALRGVLASTFRPQHAHLAVVSCPFPAMPEDLKNEEVQWLSLPFRCRVTGLELTSAGQLRHPKLVTFLPKEPLS
ncbi:DNA ligase [Paenibacillus sacheonensis]|uniref:DNA ligase n=1 Tax=Paenibacillus sacheonensis TaxID=742054 RepID=A0A7X4YPI0_9BACL|nr:DNA ligase [Paenibacillus sacheonensis]MBM7565125.1 bifunctional non-homologous end joining protein LigD [Paenibacillus sacheonensis]NBC70092.1 DNA ligase [Paenibacillus sacheonensis]